MSRCPTLATPTALCAGIQLGETAWFSKTGRTLVRVHRMASGLRRKARRPSFTTLTMTRPCTRHAWMGASFGQSLARHLQIHASNRISRPGLLLHLGAISFTWPMVMGATIFTSTPQMAHTQATPSEGVAHRMVCFLPATRSITIPDRKNSWFQIAKTIDISTSTSTLLQLLSSRTTPTSKTKSCNVLAISASTSAMAMQSFPLWKAP
mmetsp:Transcript_37847/g.68400  ORF Transcript_37847/g.68400 Transcript_37847/m.68400 type:complete len:208 (+) Transcript_37847:236-859(+)